MLSKDKNCHGIRDPRYLLSFRIQKESQPEIFCQVNLLLLVSIVRVVVVRLVAQASLSTQQIQVRFEIGKQILIQRDFVVCEFTG